MNQFVRQKTHGDGIITHIRRQARPENPAAAHHDLRATSDQPRQPRYPVMVVDQPDRLKRYGIQQSYWQGVDLGSSERAYLNHCDEA